MFVHGVVGLLEEAVAVNLFLEVFFLSLCITGFAHF